MTNKVNHVQGILTTQSAKNGSHYLVFASDTTTRAYIEMKGDAVKRAACYMKLIGNNFEFEPQNEECKISQKVNFIYMTGKIFH